MYGRKKIFQFSIATFLIGSLLCGAAGNLTVLVLFRGLQGIGGGGLNSLVMAITGDLVPARQRSKYQAVTGMVATLALIAGPLLGGVFSDDLSWRWIFYLNLPIGVVAFLAVGARLHLPRRSAGGRIDYLGGLLAAVFTTAVAILTAGLGSGTTVHAFRTVFFWTVPFMGLAFVLSVCMREKPLSTEMMEVAEGRVEVPEY
jgi:MFS family permease